MRTDDRDDLVGDVADALTLDQQVQWERCARLAAGAERAQIENLRVIERVLASRPVAGPAAETVPATRFYGRAGVRHAVHALIALASLEVAATLLLLPWAWGDYYRAHGEAAGQSGFSRARISHRNGRANAAAGSSAAGDPVDCPRHMSCMRPDTGSPAEYDTRPPRTGIRTVRVRLVWQPAR